MKIGILSMQEVDNYGSVLQAYSLKKIIEEETCTEVSFINIDRSITISLQRHNKVTLDYKDNKKVQNNIIYNFNKLINKIKLKKLYVVMSAFREKELEITQKINEDIDIVVIGSDEVFGTRYLQLYGAVENYEKIISYAASCGANKAEYICDESIDSIKNALSKLSVVSVRDYGSERFVKSFYDTDIKYHLDPVLVGSLNMRQNKKVNIKNYMVVYAYGNRITEKHEIEAIKEYAKKHRLKILALGAPQFWCDEYKVLSPFELLDYFHYADCIVTDTFHGVIFSVINHCKFACIVRPSNENKLMDLIGRLELKTQILLDVDRLEEVINNNINYDVIDKILKVEKLRTRRYIRDNILGVNEESNNSNVFI